MAGSTTTARSSHAASGEGQPATSSSTPAAPPNVRSTSPYGTRSRNRGARVNYAEDRDTEMDYEYADPAAPPAPPPPASTAATATEVNGSTNDSATGGPSSSTTSSRKQKGTNASSKEPKEPGLRETSTALTAPATSMAAGKKRKGAAMAVALPPLPKDYSLSNMLSFSDPYLKDGKLVADDGTTLQVHDHIYLICEPPGEPYYLARIMEFLHTSNDPEKPVDSVRVNWYYRPKDINRKLTDTRVLFASMHSDCCPLNSIRGKCWIAHRTEIENLDEYRKQRDHFYFERMFDRYIHRYYDVIPTKNVRNVPENIRIALLQRWKFLLVEPQRGKELCSQVKTCKRCNQFCANSNSVHCAVCDCTYHMACVTPPLKHKPTRGFAWACARCSRVQERRLEARNTPNGTGVNGDIDEEHLEDEEEDGQAAPGTETPSDAAPEPIHLPEPTPDQLKITSMWQMRYLGQHCKVEDALDYDDRIYPRAVSRLGPKHQAVVPPWPGRPFELVKPAEGRKRYGKGPGGRTKVIDADNGKEKRPAWVIDEPAGYIERGGDDGGTSTLLFKLPDQPEVYTEKEQVLNNYMRQTEKIAEGMKMKPYATNFMDKAAELLFANNFNDKKALESLAKVQPVRDLKEPRLKPDEIKRFEEGVAKFGSELHLVAKHVKTRKEADIVRFYYQWKKTDRGREIWGNFDNRKSKKEAKLKDKEGVVAPTGPKLLDDVADDEDDSAFDEDKAYAKKRGFKCKHCGTTHSRQWRRAPQVAPGTLIPAEKAGGSKKKSKDLEDKWLVLALCRRCAEIWRRYAIVWEDPDEIQKKVSAGGGRAWKRRIDEELLRELFAAQADDRAEALAFSSVTPQPGSESGTATPDVQPPPKKKAKTDKKKAAEKEKEKEKEKAEVKEAPPPPPPEPPKPKLITCGVCDITEEAGKQHATCRECKMTVHKRCYGVEEVRIANKWLCEMCQNDKNPIVSTNYECVLCPHKSDPDPAATDSEHIAKPSHKKKKAAPPATGENSKEVTPTPESDIRKIKDIRDSLEKIRPTTPREPLKKTANNNWAHVVCSVWTPEIKFSDPATLKVVEGIGAIPSQRWMQTCKVCGKGGGTNGACVGCHACHAPVHVSCAKSTGWTLGFDISPVKGSRRDTVSIVKIGGETGNMVAGVWCPAHDVSGVHKMTEVSEETGQTALELFAKTYKQADLMLTGTVRKASLVTLSTKATNAVRRASIIGNAIKEGADSTTPIVIKNDDGERVCGIAGLLNDHVGGDGHKQCIECKVEFSPIWWKIPIPQPLPAATNGASAVLTNGTSNRNRAIGLLCNRCHIKQTQTNGAPSFGPPPIMNGDHQTSSRFQPLPPLQVFLAEQHAPPPPPPPPPPPSQPPVNAHPMNGPLLGGCMHPVSRPDMSSIPTQMAPHQPPPPLSIGSMIHGPTHTYPLPQSSPTRILHHPPPLSQPPHPSHIPAHSPTRTMHHSPPRGMIPTHAPPPPLQNHQNHIPHMSPHKVPMQIHHSASPQYSHTRMPLHTNPGPPPPPPPPPPMAYSRPPPPPMGMQQHQQQQPPTSLPPPPMNAPQAMMGGGLPLQGPHHQQPPHQPRPEEQRRMSGASGSPALANLLS